MSERRERRGFEPPPWEREEFERFSQERAAKEPRETVTETPVVAAAAAATGRETVAAAVKAEAAGTDAEATKGLPDATIERMLIDLRLEEPKAKQQYTALANVVAGLLLTSGLGFVVWSAVLFARSQSTAGSIAVATPIATATASALMTMWGFMLVGGAVLLWRKYNVR